MVHFRSDVMIEAGVAVKVKTEARSKLEVNIKYWVRRIKVNVKDQVRIQVKDRKSVV